MSLARNFLPLATVSAIGIGTGVYIFQPAIEEQKNAQRDFALSHASDPTTTPHPPSSPEISSAPSSHPAPVSPSEVLRQTEINVANAGGATTIPRETPRFGVVGSGFVEEGGRARGFEWGR
ncbi:MAG: hypothetical protein OHK93_004576 [Ramalina farinacea]|uniref:Uncharacterized protein n=1 Tax=Ramalina farinacea TaxID=258253 RepID=A0AA43QUD8_9LECA|nr:hypothetical protein [Ramalina farinacea]